MRPKLLTLALIFGIGIGIGIGSAPALHGQTACTGLCLQQVSCPNGGTTTITGRVMAPNGTDPLPNVLVYVPNAPVAAFPVGLSCPVVGAVPLGTPLVGATTAGDGTFVITNAPVGSAIPLVAVTGKWRRQTTVDTSLGSCATTIVATDAIRMPRNQSEGDIPKFAIATGSQDQVECVLLKVGLDQAEFTNPAGTGRINLFAGSSSKGAIIASTATAPQMTQEQLMSDSPTLANYDVLMLPCQGNAANQATGTTAGKPISSNDLPNLLGFANGGGRIYASHYSDVWFYQNPTLAGTAQYYANGSSTTPTDPNPTPSDPNGPNATIDVTFPEGATLAKWLPLVGASASSGTNEMHLNTLRKDTYGVNSPTQAWLRLNDVANTVMQFVFNTPINGTNQCGRILFNEYHVESPTASASNSGIFPTECNLTAAATPQEKLLEFSLFDLTNDGGAFTLTPTTQAYGNQNVGSSSSSAAFTFTNNAVFAASISSVTASPNYTVTGNGCGASVAPGGICQINVAFSPTTTGPLTGTLNVAASATSLISTLTGNGVDFSLAVAPTSGHVIAGYNVTTVATVTPIAGFSFPVTLSCSTTAPGSICTPALTSFVPTAAVSTNVLITSTAQYAVIGYGAGVSGNLWLSLIALASGTLIWFRRRSTGKLARAAVFLLFAATLAALTTGCSGKLPAKNAVYTIPGDYTYTITATSGSLSHSATYMLNVTAK